MKKEEIIGLFDCCENKLEENDDVLYSDYGTLDEKKSVFNDGYSKIKSALTFCPDDVLFDGLSSLEEFDDSKESLYLFIRRNNVRTIEIRIEAIYCEIKTLANRRSSEESAIKKAQAFEESAIKKAQAFEISNAWLAQRQMKNHKVAFPIFISLFIFFALCLIVLAALPACGVFEENSTESRVCNAVSTVSGALDFVNGVAFFIYERRDDKKKAAMQSDLQKIVNDGINGGINISYGTFKNKGNNNNFGISLNGNGDDKNLDIETFGRNYSIRSKKFKNKGNNNSFGISLNGNGSDKNTSK